MAHNGNAIHTVHALQSFFLPATQGLVFGVSHTAREIPPVYRCSKVGSTLFRWLYGAGLCLRSCG